MRLAGLYDIHGNIDALEAVLADPRLDGVDAVLIGGDAVPGPFAAATLARLDGLSVPVTWVRGNGEREVAAAVSDAEAGRVAPRTGDEAADMAAITAAATTAELAPERARALGTLPLTVEIDRVLYCHATPRRDDEILTRISAPDRWAEALAGVTAHAVIAGHTHQCDDRTVGSIRFINAGSVGLPYEGDGVARWVRVSDGVPEACTTAYDAAAAGVRMLDVGWPDEESIRAALIEPIDPIVVTRLFEGISEA